jgi:hypothetical protein
MKHDGSVRAFAPHLPQDGVPQWGAGARPASTLTIRQWLERVQGEYREMPGLSLTQLQAQRLWGLDAVLCEALFEALTHSGFLRRTAQGGYIRGDIAR